MIRQIFGTWCLEVPPLSSNFLTIATDQWCFALPEFMWMLFVRLGSHCHTSQLVMWRVSPMTKIQTISFNWSGCQILNSYQSVEIYMAARSLADSDYRPRIHTRDQISTSKQDNVARLSVLPKRSPARHNISESTSRKEWWPSLSLQVLATYG